MKKFLIAITVLMVSLAGQAQNTIRGSVQKNVDPTKIDIVFRANYNKAYFFLKHAFLDGFEVVDRYIEVGARVAGSCVARCYVEIGQERTLCNFPCHSMFAST